MDRRTETAFFADSPRPAEPPLASLIGRAFGVRLSDAELSPDLVRRIMMIHGFPEGVPDWVFIRLAAYVTGSRPDTPAASERRTPTAWTREGLRADFTDK
jgi:hypothetical protein